ncbi:MAG: SMI1/KNR4 family protein [Proteobacteria bacterium]|nr:SMI1/KNR4 family protein [Pseudomonadota bacterium]
MYQITESMLDSWNEDNKPKATTTDISRINAAIGAELPTPYVEFITQFGFVIFGLDMEERYHFDYIIVFPDRKEIHEGNIRFMLQTDRLLKAYENLTTSEFNNDDEFPKFPTKYLPVGNDAGQGKILLELGEHAGRVWYWPFNEWAWGVEHNTWLGFVAEDFYDFINRLRP